MAGTDPLIDAILESAAPVAEATPSASPADITALMTRLQNGELPTGMNLDTIMQESMNSQTEIQERADIVTSTVAAHSAERDALQANVTGASQAVISANRGVRDATVFLEQDKEAVAHEQLDRQVLLEQELLDLTRSQLDEQYDIDEQLDELTRSQNANYEILKENADQGIMDFIKNPIQRIQLRIAANHADTQVKIERGQIDTLKGIRELDTHEYQQQSSELALMVTLKSVAQAQNLHREIESTAILGTANANKAMSDGDLQNIADTMGINQQAMQIAAQELQMLASESTLTQAKYNDVIAIAQAATATLNYKKLDTAIALDANIAAANETMYAAYRETFPNSYATYAAFRQAGVDGIVSPSMLHNYSNFANAGILNSNTILRSGSPYATGMAMNETGQLRPGISNVLGGIEHIKVNGMSLSQNEIFATLTPDRQILAKDKQIRDWGFAVEDDIDNVFTNNLPLAKIVSPDAMNYEMAGGLNTMPTAAVEIMQEWNLPTTSYAEFVEGFIRKAGREDTLSVEQMAFAAVSMSEMFLRSANNSTGLGLTSINTPSLGLDGSSRNGADADVWVAAIQSKMSRGNLIEKAVRGAFGAIGDLNRGADNLRDRLIGHGDQD